MSQNLSSAVMQQRSEPQWYFTGIPCPRGHIAKRNKSNRECRACVVEKRKAKRLADPEKYRAKDREKYHAAGERKREQMRNSRQKHIEARREYDRKRYHENPERMLAAKKRANQWWQENEVNRAKKRFMTQRKRSWVKLATPAWLTDQQRDEIRQFFLNANGKSVDHIVPLRGKNVCGLNVPWNLQHLDRLENIRKGNRYAE